MISKKQKPTEIGIVCTYTTILGKVIQASASPSWLRNSSVSTAKESYSQKLTHLLKFLRLEVEGEQRVLLAKSGFKSNDSSKSKPEQRHRNEDIKTLLTSAALVSTGKEEGPVKKCIFCSKFIHKSSEC
ncbi:hypothetical protein TNIN_314421 [Trichonephila inaurata madagascariensis]|uniref:Uncharacterized protein n=1 Tax=Trichonephila inaurata madagascariensis TaxID=2747483 RepID=A0A8X6X664_9ARAC|nr:hypothetical protein TNIN_314421 [Trichonephila inaurata madagascariensis]